MKLFRIDRRLPVNVGAYWRFARVWDRWKIEVTETGNRETHVLQRRLTVEAVRSLGSSVRVMDLCCGTGRICHDLLGLPNVAEVMAIDVSEAALNELTTKLAQHPQRHKLTVLRRDVLQADALIDLGQFDAVICIDALHHLYDLRLAVTLLDELARPAGIVIGNCLARERARHHVSLKSGPISYLAMAARANLMRMFCISQSVSEFVGRKGYVRMHILDRDDVGALLETRFSVVQVVSNDYHWFVVRTKPEPR